jgi:Tfp pilus assembly protein PilE
MSQRERGQCAGFTYTEFAVVLAVTAILITVAYSAYRTHSVRVELARAISAMESLKHAVEETFRRTGVPPATLADLSAPLSIGSELIEEVRIEHGRIELTFSTVADAGLANRSLYLTPFETVDHRVVWVCGSRLPGVGLNPLGFAAGALQPKPIATTIEERFLLRECR